MQRIRAKLPPSHVGGVEMNVKSSRIGNCFRRIVILSVLLIGLNTAAETQGQAQVYLPTMYEELYGT